MQKYFSIHYRYEHRNGVAVAPTDLSSLNAFGGMEMTTSGAGNDEELSILPINGAGNDDGLSILSIKSINGADRNEGLSILLINGGGSDERLLLPINGAEIDEGLSTLPINNRDLVQLQRTMKRKGWSAWNSKAIDAHWAITMAAVAAAASLPSSFTSMKALCTTLDRKRLRVPSIFDRSDLLSENTSSIPILERVSFKLADSSNLNLGNATFTSFRLCGWSRRFARWSVVRFASRLARPSLSSGNRMIMHKDSPLYGSSSALVLSSLM